MPAAPLILEPGRLLQDDDCDIRDECGIIEDGVLDIRRKFALVVYEGRQLQKALLAQQAEIENLTTRVLDYESSAMVTRNSLLAQRRRLREYRKSEKTLGHRNRELIEELEAAHTSLEKTAHLECGVCMANAIDTFTRCGHGFCRKCITFWLRETKTANEARNGCPTCRQPVEEIDLITIYLDSGMQASIAAEDDRATENLDSQSD